MVPAAVPATAAVKEEFAGAVVVDKEAVRVTERVGAGDGELKVEVTFLFAVILTTHWLPEEESQPVQLPNTEPPAGVAVRVTAVPEL